MNAITKTTPVAVLVTLSVALAAQSAEPLPYGRSNFVPTPERPVYFRQNNACYPGATPPLEWWDGTPTTRKVKGVFGNPPRHREMDVLDFADTTSKNIRWKVPVPGWSLSHPIVVGGRVFAVGEPDFVTCWDLETGKQLWQRRIMPLLCDGLSEEKAAAGQKVLDLARAFFYIASYGSRAGQQPGNLFGGFKRDGTPQSTDHAAFVAEKKALARKLIDALAPHRPEVEAFGDADLLAAVDKDLALLKRYMEAPDLAALQALMQEKRPGSHDRHRPLYLAAACANKLGVDIGGYWWGYVGTADSTLASDGRRIYGVFDQGQVFALDLDGKIVWLQREKGGHDNRGAFHRSPLLCDGLLLVRSFTVKGHARPLRALDVKTGQVCWEAPLAGSNYTVPRLMRLKDPAGAGVDVLIGDAPASKEQGQQIVRVRDGKVIGHIPHQPCGRGALMGISGDPAESGTGVVTWGSTDDRGGGPSCAYRVTLTDTDTATAEPLFVFSERKDRIFRNQADFPTMPGTAWLYGNQLFDATNGTLVSKLPARVGNLGVVAGHHLITLAGGANDGLYGRGGSGSRGRDDHMVSCQFMVIDIKDPAKPVLVAKNNLLGYKEPAADIIVSTYFKDFNPMDFAGCYKGVASYFMLMSGPVPHGDKLLIQSSAFLYCIAP